MDSIILNLVKIIIVVNIPFKTIEKELNKFICININYVILIIWVKSLKKRVIYNTKDLSKKLKSHWVWEALPK